LEIVYVSRGHLRWEVDGRVENVCPQSVFFTLPWEEHGSRDEYEPGHHWYWVVLRLRENTGKSQWNFSLHPALGFSKAETACIRCALTGASHRSIRASREIAWILPQLVSECRGTNPLAKPAVQSLTRLLIVELVRCIQLEKPADKVLAGVETRMRACIQVIRERCSEPWTLEKMSRQSGLSRTRFSDLLKKITGDTPTIYLRRMRVNHAQQLLRTTDRRITEIALESGFETSQHFARIFKGFSKQSASQYRESHRQ
jgi:AraC-like DNA-binding protein